jgi:hypothetical protein
MKFFKMNLFSIIGLTIIIICVVIATATRFQNPELTETQLFLRFWPLYLGTGVGMLGGFGLMR